jgi:O-methyltransferase
MKAVTEMAGQSWDLVRSVEPAYRRHSRTSQLFRPYTMIWPRLYISNLKLAERVVGMPGAIVECGTWRGGMIAGIAKTLGPRDYWLFDSFEGLPPAEPLDGEKAVAYQLDTDSPHYYNNCTASEDDAVEAMRLAGVPDPHLVKGWFEDTLTSGVFGEGIALLRLDADWYKSTYQILDVLFPQVNPGGLILIDDYRTWPGCRKAVHDYLGEHDRCERVKRFGGVYYMTKLPPATPP